MNDAAICATAKRAQPPVRARRQSRAAIGEAEAVRRFRGWKARHERKQHRRGNGQTDTYPEQARINGDVQARTEKRDA
jgi:hypothetical protein